MQELDRLIDNFLYSKSQRDKRSLYTYIVSLELLLHANDKSGDGVYLYDNENVYICSPVQTLNLSQRLRYEIDGSRMLVSGGVERSPIDGAKAKPRLIVPSYTRVSRDVIAQVADVIRFDIPRSYIDYINERSRR